MIRIEMTRKTGAYGFDVKDSMAHVLQTDSSAESGGMDSGFRPMQLLLAALGSCSAIDVIAILEKQRQQVKEIAITVDAERETGKEPALWTKAHMTFLIVGTVDEDKANRAAELSVMKYCSVAETLRRAGAEITWQVEVKKPANT